MNRKVLLIGETNSFMVNGIASGLRRENYDVTCVAIDVDELGRIKEEFPIWVLYLDGMSTVIQRPLSFIKEMISDKELYFFPIGNVDELEAIHGVIPEKLCTKSFLRPLNVKDLTAELENTVIKGTMAEEKKKILIVDDDTTMLKMMRNLLSEKYHVYMANSGMNAIAFLTKNNVDLVLLDYEMPVISGAKVLEMMRSEPETSDIPVMFLTGKNDRESVMSAVPLHPEKYLLKTMQPEEWLENIDDFFLKKKKKSLS